MSTTRCTKQATVKQQMTHKARLALMLSHSASLQDAPSSERYVCEEHADVIDRDWLVVECVNLGDVTSVLTWADRKCEWEDETTNIEFERSALCLHGVPRKYCESCSKIWGGP